MLEYIAYSANQLFFGGFSADEDSAANTANGAGLGSSWYSKTALNVDENADKLTNSADDNGIVMSPLRRHIFVCFMAKSAF